MGPNDSRLRVVAHLKSLGYRVPNDGLLDDEPQPRDPMGDAYDRARDRAEEDSLND